MGWKIFFGFIFLLIVVSLLAFYWFVPFKTLDFGTKSESYNFTLDGKISVQFYPSMRFPDKEISYKIYDCTLQKTNEMERAFEIISDKSLINFYPVMYDEQISVNCDSHDKMKEGLFIAGEGGPTNVTKIGNFYVILNGNILLIRDSKCANPNVAIHELLHVLGFNHSENQNNIMYPILNCDQIIGDDTFELIDELYSVPSYVDLNFENVSAVINGRYLDTEISVKNNGLKNSESSKLEIYADDELVKEIELDALKIGYGRKVVLGNVWVPLDVNELEFVIEYPYEELEKNNNKIKLEIKK